MRILLALCGLVALVVALDALIETDREKIESLLESARAAAERGDPGEVMGCVDPAYDYQGWNFEGLRSRVHEGLRTLRPRKVTFERPQIVLQEDRAQASLTVVTTPSENSRFPAPGQFEIDLGLSRKGGRWLITSVALNE